MNIKDLIKEVHDYILSHGFWENPSLPEKLALIHSEVSEALEEVRNGRKPNETYYSGKDTSKSPNFKEDLESITIITTAKNSSENIYKSIINNKPEGVPSELADIVLRVFDICGYYDIDLEAMIKEKMAYNRTRKYRHGGKLL